jgi:hypothetical protein
LFRLHFHFVPGERIGIEEIGAVEVLTNGLACTRSRSRRCSRAARAASTSIHNSFRIRLPFVPEERIGIGEISTAQFLTIDEAVLRHFLGGRNFDTTANTMTISRQGSQRNVLVEFAVIGLAHCGQVMRG